jgi:biotin transporter BioY
MPHEVFVSYSSDDKSTAETVCDALESNGMHCWIASRDILPSTDWGGAIVNAINASRVMVLVYSAKANDSPQIKREVERAVNRGLAVIPFRIEDVPMSPTLEYFMSTPHWLDAFTPPLQDHLDRLVQTTRVILDRTGADVAMAPGGHTRDRESAQPLTTSSEAARDIWHWVTGGKEAPTLAAVLVPRSDVVGTSTLIAACAAALSILAQVRLGPIWLQPPAVLLTGAILGSRAGAVATASYVALGIIGLPVFGPGVSAWTSVNFGAPYVRYGLGYLLGLVAAAFAVGWLSERRLWDRHYASAARLALAGIAIMYLPGFVWLEVAALLLRERSAPAGVLPSIAMLVITVAFLAFALPRAWAAAGAMRRAASESKSVAVSTHAAPTDTTHTGSPR